MSLFQAIEREDVEYVRTIVNNPNADVNSENQDPVSFYNFKFIYKNAILHLLF